MALKPVLVMMGGDPELFVSKGDAVIGSEKIIPELGLKGGTNIKPSVVRDGIQIELNPQARATVGLLAVEISTAMEMLERVVRKNEGVKLDWRGLVEVDRAELDSLSEKSRILGCKPSFNIYGERPIKVDPATYRKRSAGGHMHFGLRNPLFKSRLDLIPPFDILVANQCVMMDRDPNAAERRENYGRVGEYRTPAYGIEYRCLSNFWLRNYTLMSFVYGMANFAISMVSERLAGNDLESELIQLVNIDNVVKAVDTNNFELAKANFKAIRPFLVKHLPERGFPLTPSNLDRFMLFVEGVQDHGIEGFFPVDPVEHWVRGNRVDFDQFLNTIY